MTDEKSTTSKSFNVSGNGAIGHENLQLKSNLLSPEKDSFKVETQKKISSAKGTTGKKRPSSCQSLRINSLKKVKKNEKKPNSGENNKKGLSCVREINAKAVQNVKMKKDAPLKKIKNDAPLKKIKNDAPLKKIKNDAPLKKKDLTISPIKAPIRKPAVPLNDVENTQEPIKEQIENSRELLSEVFNSEAPIDVLNTQIISEDQMENSEDQLDVVNTQPPIEQIFHSDIPLGVLNTQKLVIEDQNIYSEEPLVVNIQLSFEEQMVNSEILVDVLKTQLLPIEGQTTHSVELLDVVNIPPLPIIDIIGEKPLNIVNIQSPIIGDQIIYSEKPLDVNTQLSIEKQIVISETSVDILKTQLPTEGQTGYSEELLGVGNTQLPIIEDEIENSKEPLDVVNTQLPIFEDQIKNAEELLDVVNTQLPIIEDHNENSEESLDGVNTQLPIIEDKNRKKSLPIIENNNQLKTSANIQGRIGHLKKKIGRIVDNSKQFDIKKSLSQRVSRQIHNNQSAKRQQSYEKISVKKIRMFMKKKNLLDSILNFYQEDLNKPGNKRKPFLLSIKKTK